MEEPFVFTPPGLPTRYVAVGRELRRYGRTLVCVSRPDVASPDMACKGCFFKRSRVGGVVVNCNDIQCSCWDRMDGADVWFVEAGGEDLP